MARGRGRFDDPDNYLPLARSLAAGEGFMSRGVRPPIGRRSTRLMLAPLVSLGERVSSPGDRAVAPRSWCRHRMVDSGRGQRFGPLARANAALPRFMVACDPVLVWQSRSVMTETPAAFLLAAGPGRALPAGVAGSRCLGGLRLRSGRALPAERARREPC